MKSVLTKTKQVRFNRRRRGATIVVVVLCMSVLLGFTALSVDYGIQVSTKNQLQRACDAAALAGASQLKVTGDIEFDRYRARYLAFTTAKENGTNVVWNDITFANSETQIRVPAAKTRSFFFAWAVGVPTGRVRANATADIAAGDGLDTPYVAPIGITWDTYNAYRNDGELHDISLIRQNKQTFGLDDFVLFDLRESNAKSIAHFEQQLIGAEIETAEIGDYETTLNAALAAQEGGVEGGTSTIFERSTQSPWFDGATTGVRYNDITSGASPRNNPRVVHMIITPSTERSSNGTFDTQIQGFVPVYLEAVRTATITTVDNNGNPTTAEVKQLQIRFLPPTNSSDGQVDAAPPYVPGTTAPVTYSGVRVIRLTS